MKKVALITGITGQDGSYLAELLIEKGYKVYGIVRRTSTRVSIERISHLLTDKKVEIIEGDLHDLSSLIRAVKDINPDEVYNLAAQSFVKTSWDQPILTAEYTGLGVLRVLEALRCVGKQGVKFYQASSSEMFGNSEEFPQSERTRFSPRSPYGVSKVFGHYITVNYRESYNMFAVSGILFNHESPRRGIEFVTRKITDAVARIKLGLSDCLYLGDIYVKRDWGFAGDYVKAMWLMLQQDKPEDFVVGSGELHSVKEFVEIAFSHVGLDWNKYVKTDEALMRPAEVFALQADPTKAKQKLGWKPEVSFEQLVKMMVDSDVERLKK